MMPALHNARTGRATRFVLSLTLFVFAGLFGAHANAQLVGTKNVPGDYADLALAIADLNTQGVGAGGVTINLVAANPQTAPAGGYSIATTTASAANPVSIVGNGNTVTASAAHTVGAINDAIFKIVGTDNVSLSGFTLLESAANTTTAVATNNMTEFGVALFYATATDNAQNITIQNNSISLNRASTNTFGIYANATHTATAVGTTASGTGAAGGNSGLRIYGNTISNVNNGIVVIGPTAAADANDGVDIGGASAATGNTLSNYGTGSAGSTFVNAPSASIAGITIRNTKNYNASFNAISSSTATTIPTATSSGTLRAVYVPAASIVPLGTIANSINNNAIALRAGAAATIVQGIIVEASNGNATTTNNINDNNFTDVSFNISGTTAISLISSLAVVLNSNINNNTFTNLTINNNLGVTFIAHGFTLPTNGTKNVNNNRIITAFNKTVAGGTVTFHADGASSAAGTSSNNNNNNFSNVTVTGATAIAGWINQDGNGAGTVVKTVTGNTFVNLVGGLTGGSGVTGMNIGFGGTQTVANNVVSNLSGSGTVTGITTSSSGTSSFDQNTVHTLLSSGASNVTGMICASGTTVSFSRNKIFNLEGVNASSAALGMTVSGGTTVNVFNNLIGDLRLPNSGANVSLVGLNITGGTTVNASFNTVRLAATSSGASFGSVAVLASTTPTVNLRNNNFVNLSTANGTGLTIAYRRSSPTLTSYGSVSNNNNFYAGTPSATNVIFADTTNIDQTLAAFKVRVSSRDSASITENPPFLSTSGASAQFLHISTAIATQLESGATPIAGITTDFDGDTRNVSSPDIGADEFTGIVLDLTGPAISFTPLSNTSLSTNRLLNVTINDPAGVAGGAVAPRVYFRKGVGSYFSTACTGSAPAYVCTIDNGLLGGVVVTDVINYFVIAQDLLGNISAQPGGGLVATDVNTVTTPPTTPAAYTIVATFPTVVMVGTGETITSLTNAGGLFEAINARVLTGNVTVNLTSDLIAETGTVALNQFAEEGAGNYTILIQASGGPRLVSGSNTTALINLNGADRVTFSGIASGPLGLTIRNTSTTTGAVFQLINDASNNGIVNCTIEGGNTSTTSAVILIGAGTSTGNDNNLIANSVVRDRSDVVGVPANLIASLNGSTVATNSFNLVSGNQLRNFISNGFATSAAASSDNWTFTNNDISQSGTRAGNTFGINTGGMAGTNIFSGNSIHGFVSSGANAILGFLVGNSLNLTISKNRIYDFQTTAAATGVIEGIEFDGASGGAASVTVVNNMITLAPVVSTAQSVIGIQDFGFGGNTFTANYNSVYVGGTASGAASSWAMKRGNGSPTTYTARNNLQFNNRTGGTGSHFAGGDDSANTGTFVSNFNFFAGTGSTPANFMDYGTAGTGTPVSFVAWQAGPPTRDANSIANIAGSLIASDYFVDFANGDLHLKPTAPLVIGAGTPVVGVTDDFDGDPRATAVEIGADELNSAPVITPTAGGVTRQQDTAASNSQIAVVSDNETAAGSLVVTTQGALPIGITVSGIVNSGGNVTANVAASCGAMVGANNVGLRVTDTGTSTLFTDANLTVNVTANTAPVLGVYPAASATTGGGNTVTPGAAPTDNGTISTITASAPGFTGTFLVNTSTGVVTVSNAGPAAVYTVTVTATDACGLQSTATFQLTVSNANTAPTITPAAALTRQQGTAGTVSGLATVSDVESGAASVVVTAQSVPANLSVTGITNTAGAISGTVAAACNATVGANTVVLRATDPGTLFTDGNLTVNVTANTAPVQGTYGNLSVLVGSSGSTATPSAAPTDNGTVTTVTAAATGGFTGSFVGNAGTGVITVNSATPVGVYPVTVTATDNCGATSTRNFTLTVTAANTAPNIVPASVTPKAGDASAVRTIANVSDVEDAENLLVVTINGGASATSNGVTVGGISVNAMGIVSANVVATCSATNASFTLRVTDTGTLFNEATVNTNVTANTAPTLSYSAVSLQSGTGTTVNPATGPTDSGGVTSIVMQSLGTYTGTASVNGSGVVTISNAAPEGSHTLTIRATDNCALTTDATLLLNVLGDTVFANGFEDVVRTPAQMKLPLGESGKALSLILPMFELQQVANAQAIVDVIEFNIGGSRVLLQVRQHNGVREMRVVNFNAASGRQEGSWHDAIGQGALRLEWSGQSQHGQQYLKAALKAAD